MVEKNSMAVSDVVAVSKHLSGTQKILSNLLSAAAIHDHTTHDRPLLLALP